MASPTRVKDRRRLLKSKKLGRRRKNRLESKGTTPTRAQLFGDEPAKGSAKKA